MGLVLAVLEEFMEGARERLESFLRMDPSETLSASRRLEPSACKYWCCMDEPVSALDVLRSMVE
jgi:hypothetical protein